MPITKLDDFLNLNRRFVQLEKEAENEQNRILIESHTLNELCKAGVALKKLRVVHERTGFGGRREVKLEMCQNTTEDSYKSHKFSPGDIVSLCASSNHNKPLASGVVIKISELYVSIAFDDWNENSIGADNRTFCLIQAVNDVTYKRWLKTADDMEKFDEFPGAALVRYLFGKTQLPKTDDVGEENASIYFENNTAADAAVKFCLPKSRAVSIVHGPPGTGKTTTLVKIIRILVDRGQKVLVCAPSNVAVDNLVERLAAENIKLVRIGHPARTHENLREYCLDYMLKRSDQASLIDDIRSEIDNLFRGKYRGPDKKTEKSRLKRELKNREMLALKEVLASTRVICCTLTMAAAENLNSLSPIGQFLSIHSKFDCVVIDECAQAIELACWSALLLGDRCIVAGDYNQLAPTILSERAARDGFSKTLMRRIVDEFPADLVDQDLVRLLVRQYRMNSAIMNWASKQMYGDKLEADASVDQHLLRDLPNVLDCEETSTPLLLIDTADCDMNEIDSTDDGSKANMGEVSLVSLHVSKLISSGVPPSSIAVITPYNFQVHFLRIYVGSAFPQISIRSVDGFQGQEREAVILSLVRSNDKREVGFLSDRKRINVAATRARRHLAVICNSSCVGRDFFIKSLIEHIEKNGVVKSASEFDETDIAKVTRLFEKDLEITSESKKPPPKPKGKKRKK